MSALLFALSWYSLYCHLFTSSWHNDRTLDVRRTCFIIQNKPCKVSLDLFTGKLIRRVAFVYFLAYITLMLDIGYGLVLNLKRARKERQVLRKLHITFGIVFFIFHLCWEIKSYILNLLHCEFVLRVFCILTSSLVNADLNLD